MVPQLVGTLAVTPELSVKTLLDGVAHVLGVITRVLGGAQALGRNTEQLFQRMRHPAATLLPLLALLELIEAVLGVIALILGGAQTVLGGSQPSLELREVGPMVPHGVHRHVRSGIDVGGVRRGADKDGRGNQENSSELHLKFVGNGRC